MANCEENTCIRETFLTVYNGIKVLIAPNTIDDKIIIIPLQKSALFLKNWTYTVIALKGKTSSFGDTSFCVFAKVVL